METVKQLIKKKESKAAADYKKLIAKRKKEEQETLKNEILFIIEHAEYHSFSINSSNKAVAQHIYTYTDRVCYICRCDGMICRFPEKSKIFNKWKRALESKFGINVNIHIENKQVLSSYRENVYDRYFAMEVTVKDD